MPIVNSGGVDIDYEVINPGGAGLPVFFISGLSGVRSAWTNQVGPLAGRGPVVLHDHRGTGRSAKPPGVYSVPAMAADVAAIMDDAGIAKAHFVGSSTGGAIIQVLCLDHADRVQSAVIASSWPKSDAYFLRQFAVRKKILLELGWETYTRLSTFTLYSPAYFTEHYEEIVRKEDEQIRGAPPAEVMAERIDCIMAHDQLERLPRIQAPVLVAVGREDMVTPLYYARQMAGAIPGAELKVFERGGHFVYLSHPEEFNAALLDFIGRHEG